MKIKFEIPATLQEDMNSALYAMPITDIIENMNALPLKKQQALIDYLAAKASSGGSESLENILNSMDTNEKKQLLYRLLGELLPPPPAR